MKKAILSLALLTAVCSLSQAGNWTQFRGPNSAGVANENLPAKLSKNHIQWAADLPGRGLSSAVIVGDKVIVSAASGPQQSRLHVICLSASSGKKLWERQFWSTGRTMTHPKTCVAAPTPVVADGRIYAFFSSNDLICLDLSGNLVWLRGLTSDYPNASNSLGMSSSPVYSDGVLVVQVENDSESFAAGIDGRTGRNLWKLDRPKAANWTSPIAAMIDGKPVAILQSSKGIHAVEPRTGEEIWYFGGGASTIPSSTIANGTLYVPANGITALKPGSKTRDVKELWVSGRLKPGTSSPLVLGDKIFTVNSSGVLSCGSIKDGDRLWQVRMKGKKFSATPVATRQYIYSVSESGTLQAINFRGAEGEIVSTLELGQTVLSTPSIANGAIYVRSDGKLWKIGS
ncbi:MAG: PQQ-binding-like beta-propeller repeat protein [Limisphaerales bacterium]